MTYFLKVNKRHLLLLLVLFLISLTIRLWLLDKRWINPDEGAHLMDAVLLLDGKVPLVDFDSRQPFYVYMLALFLKIFGASYISGRLLPVTCSMLTGIMVFLIARALFDETVGVLSCAIYWMLPLELINSVIVKTEPLVVLLTCLSFYAVVRFSKSNQKPWLMVAGTLAALGFYVRESAYIIPATVLGFVVFFYGGRVREITRSFGLFLVGYLGVFFLVLAYYSKFMTLGSLPMSSVSPFGTLIGVAGNLFSRYGAGSSSESVLVAHPIDAYRLYFHYLHEVFDLHSFLMIGLAFSVMTFGFHLFTFKKQEVRSEYMLSYFMLYLWVFFLFVAYAVYFASRGFFIDYFREFLPPLVIIFSAWVHQSLPSRVVDKEKIMQRLILGGLPLLGILFLFQSYHHDLSGQGFYASMAIALITLFAYIGTFESSTRRLFFALSLLAMITLIVVSRQEPLKAYLSGTIPSLGMIGVIYGVTWAYLNKKKWPFLKDYVRFISLSIAAAALVVSVSYSAILLDLAYDSPWSPQSLERTAAYLQTHTRPGDEVISGAVIWEFQASRRPYRMYSHPLHFEHSLPAEEQDEIRLAVATDPPKVIILDGFTEKTYFRQVPSIPELLQEKYELVITEGTTQNPIRVYQLKEKPV